MTYKNRRSMRKGGASGLGRSSELIGKLEKGSDCDLRNRATETYCKPEAGCYRTSNDAADPKMKCCTLDSEFKPSDCGSPVKTKRARMFCEKYPKKCAEGAVSTMKKLVQQSKNSKKRSNNVKVATKAWVGKSKKVVKSKKAKRNFNKAIKTTIANTRLLNSINNLQKNAQVTRELKNVVRQDKLNSAKKKLNAATKLKSKKKSKINYVSSSHTYTDRKNALKPSIKSCGEPDLKAITSSEKNKNRGYGNICDGAGSGQCCLPLKCIPTNKDGADANSKVLRCGVARLGKLLPADKLKKKCAGDWKKKSYCTSWNEYSTKY